MILDDILKNIARDSQVEPFNAPKELPVFTPIESNETFSPNDRVIWTATNPKNEIIAEHLATVIRETETRVYIRTDPSLLGEGFYRYVSKNRLRRIK